MFIFFAVLILVSVIIAGTMLLLNIENVPTVSEKLAQVYREFFPGMKGLHTKENMAPAPRKIKTDKDLALGGRAGGYFLSGDLFFCGWPGAMVF